MHAYQTDRGVRQIYKSEHGGREFPIVNGTSFRNNVQRIATVNHYQLAG